MDEALVAAQEAPPTPAPIAGPHLHLAAAAGHRHTPVFHTSRD